MGVKVFLLRKEITNDPDKKIFGTRGGAHSDGGSRLVLRSEQTGGLLTEDHRFVERRAEKPRFVHFFVYFGRKIFFHRFVVKNVRSEKIGVKHKFSLSAAATLYCGGKAVIRSGATLHHM